MIADACCSPLIPAAHNLAHPARAISQQSGHLLGGFALLEQPEHLPVRAFHRIAGLAVPLVQCFCCQFRLHFDSFCHTSIIHYLNGFGIIGFFSLRGSNQQSPSPLYTALTLDDPLSDNSHGYKWDENNVTFGSCAFIRGAYLVSVEGGWRYCASSSPTFSDFAYQVQVTIVKGDIGGI